MAKFKKKASRHSFGKKAHRSSHKSSGLSPMSVILPAVAYGGLRGTISNLITPLTSKVPVLGAYTDEAVFGVVGYLLAKKSKGMLKGLGYGMLAVESASIGNQLLGGMVTGTTTINSPSFGGWY